jgi:hypothetical protein
MTHIAHYGEQLCLWALLPSIIAFLWQEAKELVQ